MKKGLKMKWNLISYVASLMIAVGISSCSMVSEEVPLPAMIEETTVSESLDISIPEDEVDKKEASVISSTEAVKITAQNEELLPTPTMPSEVVITEDSKPTQESSSATVPTTTVTSPVAPVSSHIPSNAQIFFAGTNLTVHDWTVPAVSVQSSQTIGTIFVDGNGKALGTITSGKLNYDSTGYSFDVQGALDAFNDYRGLGRKDLQQGITASENPGNAAQKPEADKVDASAYAQEVIRLVNNERSSAGLNVLEVDSELMKLAAIRVKEIAANFGHVRPDGTKVSDMDYGENLSRARQSPAIAVEKWMESSGHRENIMRDGISKTGVACYQDESGTLYWVQIFSY